MTTKISLQTNNVYTASLQNDKSLDIEGLARSLVQQFFKGNNEVKKISKEEALQMGTTILGRADQIYHQAKCVRNLAFNAIENPGRFGCSVFSLVYGLARFYTGDLVGGGLGVGMGGVELYNQCTSGNNSTLHQLLNDINADVDMIKSLEEGQQQSLKYVEENLNFIRKDVDVLYNKLDKIQKLNLHEIQHIDEKRHEAYGKGLAAKEAYRDALGLFVEAKNAIFLSKQSYEKTVEFFVRIQMIAKDEEEGTPVIEKVEALVKTAKAASQVCGEGKKNLETADIKFANAMQALALASSMKNEALEMITQVVQSAEDALKAGTKEARYTKECSEKIKVSQKELKEMKERSDDVMRLLDEMATELRKAKAETKRKLDPSDVAVGIGVGTMFSALGTISSMAVGVTAAYAWHNGSTIVDTTKKVYGYFFGPPMPPITPMAANEYIRCSMDQQSSGYYGWIKGRSSFTYGHLDIKLADNEIVQFRFDLNRNGYPISKEDLFALYSRMFAKLQDKSMSVNSCEKVISGLEHLTFARGGLHPHVKGLIRPNQAASGLVRALRNYCEKLKSAPAEEILPESADQSLYENIAVMHR